MSSKDNITHTDYLRRYGDTRPDHERFTNVNPPPTDGQIAHIKAARPSTPPPAPPRYQSTKSPTFLTLKNIIMDDESLSAEQKLGLIDKISELYS
jgi:hypothetical protein